MIDRSKITPAARARMMLKSAHQQRAESARELRTAAQRQAAAVENKPLPGEPWPDDADDSSAWAGVMR